MKLEGLPADSHYTWLYNNLEAFAEVFELKDIMTLGVISAHGDKCYSYQERWEENGIPFALGVAIYLLSYFRPYSKTVRDTDNGWVAPWEWVIVFFNDHREQLKGFLG